jgi:hypothetical protein
MNEIQEKCYIEGVYRGIHVESEFNNVLKDMEIAVDIDPMLMQIKRMNYVISAVGYLVLHSEQHKMCTDLSSTFSVLPADDDDVVGDFGGRSTTLCHASSYHEDNMTLPYDSENASDLVTQDTKHQRLYGKYLRLLNSISTTDDLDDCDAALELILAKGNNGSTQNLDVLNDDGAPGRMEKRHKSFYELKK